MSNSDWVTYFNQTKDRKPRPLLVEAIEHVNSRNEALDLGSGALNDVRFLVSEGFNHVTAVDHEPLAQDIINNFPKDIVDYVICDFIDFNFEKDKFDLINSQYSLPFIYPDYLLKIIASIEDSLVTGGIFTGQFFGINDEWNVGNSKMNFHTKEQAEELLSKFKVIKFTEDESDAITAAGKMKHWHIFHFIVQK
ncbi:MAG: SAM-dependent methyltransferase [Parcubacteria bacterium C7867-006]|nr:MAG: SAM-dependent methyltransferase [Parcubacteria bacterium C7867-006]